MALYFYQAFSKEGKKITGYVDAPSLQSVKDQLGRQGLFPIVITAGASYREPSFFKRLFMGRVSIKDKILFTKQLSILLKSGVPLLQALELLVDHFEGALQTTIVAIKDDIKEGTSLAEALKKFPRVFDNIYIQLVRAGEASGNLEMILDRLTSYMERREAIRKRISSAMRTPLLQLGVAFVVVSILVVYVVPSMAEQFAQADQQLPLPTRILIGLSDAITSFWWLIALIGGLVVGGFLYWKSTPRGARTLDAIKLRLPVIKYFARMNAVVQFSYTLGLLIEGGVNLAEALDIVVSIIDNKVLAHTLSEARDKIIKQGKITQYLKQTNIFPPIAIYLIKTGEETGKLGEMLLLVARNYEEDLGELVDSLSSKLGPAMLIVMALIVGFVVISMMLPMIQMGGLAGM